MLYDVDIEASACVLSSRYAMLCYAYKCARVLFTDSQNVFEHQPWQHEQLINEYAVAYQRVDKDRHMSTIPQLQWILEFVKIQSSQGQTVGWDAFVSCRLCMYIWFL